MIDIFWRGSLPSRGSAWLACWPLICCLMLNGCAGTAPQAANEPSSYPPWVCGLSHNKDRWQCQREGEEPAPAAAPSAQAGKPAPAERPAIPASSPAAEVPTELSPPAAEPAPSSDSDAAGGVADEPFVPANGASARGPQASSAATPQRRGSGDRTDDGNQLMVLPPDHFAIQAGAFPNPESLQAHMTKHGIEPAYRVRLASNNRLFHVLILQVYESRRAAETALASLPESLDGSDLWIRSVRSLQDAVRAADALRIEQR